MSLSELDYKFLTAKAEEVIKRQLADAGQAVSETAYLQALAAARGICEYWAALIGLPGDVSKRTRVEHEDACRLEQLVEAKQVPGKHFISH